MAATTVHATNSPSGQRRGNHTQDRLLLQLRGETTSGSCRANDIVTVHQKATWSNTETARMCQNVKHVEMISGALERLQGNQIKLKSGL
jgi:hypothetical protein